MLGPEGVTRAIAEKMRTGGNKVVRRIRARGGHSASAVPYITDVSAVGPTPKSVGTSPYLWITIPDTSGRLDNRELPPTGLTDVYERVYRVNVSGLVTGQTASAAAILAHRVGLAVRDGILLDRLMDGLPDGDEGEILTRDMSEKWYEATPVGDRYEAGFIIVFPVRTREHIPTDQKWNADNPGTVDPVPADPDYPTTDPVDNLGLVEAVDVTVTEQD